jgi:hypothetical protein
MDMVESEDETVDCRTWTLIFLHYFVPGPLGPEGKGGGQGVCDSSIAPGLPPVISGVWCQRIRRPQEGIGSVDRCEADRSPQSINDMRQGGNPGCSPGRRDGCASLTPDGTSGEASDREGVAQLVAIWPALPPSVRAAILTLARAALKD